MFSPHKLVHVPALLRHLSWDLIGAYGIVVRLLAEAKVVSKVDEWHGDAKPHAQEGHHGAEGHLEEKTIGIHGVSNGQHTGGHRPLLIYSCH